MKKQNVKRKSAKARKSPKATPFGDTGAIIGDVVGKLTGLKLGGVGRWLGSGIGSIFGSGDYQITGSTPKYNVLSGQTPKFDTTHSTNIISHREYLGDITGATDFNNRVYALNPGIAETFPWLSSVAAGYQQYRFHGIIFEFRPLITDFVTSGAPGVVVMTTNYNPDERAYLSRQEAENADFAVSTKPTLGLMHMIECSSDITQYSWYNVRSQDVPDGVDKRAYDWGNFQFISQNNPAQALGELWVSYCVEFIKPILPSTRNVFTDYTYHAYRSSVTAAAPLGTVQLFVNGNMDVTMSSTVISVNFVPIGMNFHVMLFSDSVNTATTNIPNFTTVVGATTSDDYGSGASLTPNANFLATTGTVSSRSCAIYSFLATANLVVLTLPGTGTFPTSCNMNVLITTGV